MITIVKLGPENKVYIYIYIYISKYSFVKSKIKLWNQLPAEALASVPCKSHVFRKRVRRVIVIEGK